MYKVLIVDDEPWVAALIRQSIEWDRLGLVQAGVTSSGSDAYDLILKEGADIVVTDIRMPGLSGIDLIEQCRLSGMESEFIILSGYDDFKYAQQALKYNVVSFLLKPVDETELNAALADAVGRIEKRRSSVAVTARSELQLKELRESFFLKVLSSGGRELSDSLETVNQKYSLSFADGYYMTAVMRPEPVTAHNLSILQRVACECFESMGVYQFNFTENDNVIIILNPQFSLMSPGKEMFEKLFTVAATALKPYGAVVTLGVGSCETGFYSLRKSYSSALEMLRYRLTDGPGSLYIDQGRSEPTNPHAQLSISKELRLSTLIETYNIPEFKSFIFSLIDQFLNISRSPAGLFALLGQIVSACTKAVARMGITDPTALVSRDAIMTAFEACNSIDEIKHCMDKHLVRPLEQYYASHIDEDSRLTSQAKMYVCEHYSENLRLIDVANHLYRNPSYFGFVFKRDTGMSFSEYLTAYRIDIAKDLLLDFQYTVSAIAEMVGFHDFRHFSKSFKKLIGVTPTEYRKNSRS